MLLRACLLLLAMPLAAWSEPIEAHYAAYAAGLNVLNMEARLELSPVSYRLQLDYRTAGTFGLFVHSQQNAVVQGGFVTGRATPRRLVSSGVLRGASRVTEIDYSDGQPIVRQLAPPNEQEREPVSAAEQRGTIDTLSAMAELIEKVTQTGRCDGTVQTFDGRRLAQLRAWTVGTEVIPPSDLSTFTGPAVRCDFEGRQLGGFRLNQDRGRLQQPHRGSAWFAVVTPNGPALPVRIRFRTRWFGDAVMYLTAKP